MDQPAIPSRTCPACGSRKYTFRSRKKIEATEGQEAAIETKYRCKACGKVLHWKSMGAVLGPSLGRGTDIAGPMPTVRERSRQDRV